MLVYNLKYLNIIKPPIKVKQLSHIKAKEHITVIDFFTEPTNKVNNRILYKPFEGLFRVATNVSVLPIVQDYGEVDFGLA